MKSLADDSPRLSLGNIEIYAILTKQTSPSFKISPTTVFTFHRRVNGGGRYVPQTPRTRRDSGRITSLLRNNAHGLGNGRSDACHAVPSSSRLKWLHRGPVTSGFGPPISFAFITERR
ncbi:hypothetical protein LSH36_21g00075 [Paralvinella palmiformis]|uniref:Uncharacterized protein n=1 Tax=Paralvinella palmiformis TaxID=53620 RepID=A0AAD9KAY1_9ANNE|nr:hypothetical protein LSH36_21g00075 [Paralvinella palmiformis]